jgi:hypothetical protein
VPAAVAKIVGAPVACVPTAAGASAISGRLAAAHACQAAPAASSANIGDHGDLMVLSIRANQCTASSRMTAGTWPTHIAARELFN